MQNRTQQIDPYCLFLGLLGRPRRHSWIRFERLLLPSLSYQMVMVVMDGCLISRGGGNGIASGVVTPSRGGGSGIASGFLAQPHVSTSRSNNNSSKTQWAHLHNIDSAIVLG